MWHFQRIVKNRTYPTILCSFELLENRRWAKKNTWAVVNFILFRVMFKKMYKNSTTRMFPAWSFSSWFIVLYLFRLQPLSWMLCFWSRLKNWISNCTLYPIFNFCRFSVYFSCVDSFIVTLLVFYGRVAHCYSKFLRVQSVYTVEIFFQFF